MGDFEDKLVRTELTLPLYCTNEFDVDRNGDSYIVSIIYVGEEDEPAEVRVELSEIIDEMIEEYANPEGYTYLYMVAHELSRYAEELREKASYVEDSASAVGRFFDID